MLISQLVESQIHSVENCYLYESFVRVISQQLPFVSQRKHWLLQNRLTIDILKLITTLSDDETQFGLF